MNSLFFYFLLCLKHSDKYSGVRKKKKKETGICPQQTYSLLEKVGSIIQLYHRVKCSRCSCEIKQCDD